MISRLLAKYQQMGAKRRQQLWGSLAVAAISIAALATADAQQRGPYGGSDRDRSQSFGGRPKVVTQPGQFDYYVMALSWSPSYCASLQRDGYDPQCHRRDGKRYSFVLHGLWPQFERGWPESCPTADRGFVPRPVANQMADIMPSDKLVFHEYRKHGTCSGLGVDGYFKLSRELFEKVKIPEQLRNVTDQRMFTSPQEVVQDFLKLNPEMKPDGIFVECGQPGPRLKEVRICFDKEGKFRSCGRNESQSRLCSAPRVYVPPVRDASTGGGGQPQPKILQGTGQRILVSCSALHKGHSSSTAFCGRPWISTGGRLHFWGAGVPSKRLRKWRESQRYDVRVCTDRIWRRHCRSCSTGRGHTRPLSRHSLIRMRGARVSRGLRFSRRRCLLRLMLALSRFCLIPICRISRSRRRASTTKSRWSLWWSGAAQKSSGRPQNGGGRLSAAGRPGTGALRALCSGWRFGT